MPRSKPHRLLVLSALLSALSTLTLSCGSDPPSEKPCASNPPPLVCGHGVCRTFVEACVGGLPAQCPQFNPATDDPCNGLDDNCDGLVDGSCTCMQGQAQPCFGGPASAMGVGACKTGTQACENGLWGQCQGDILPEAEACDGLDNDCDGEIDELAECP